APARRRGQAAPLCPPDQRCRGDAGKPARRPLRRLCRRIERHRHLCLRCARIHSAGNLLAGEPPEARLPDRGPARERAGAEAGADRRCLAAGFRRMTAEPAIAVRGLVKSFHGRRAVDDVSLTVAKGEIAGFLGPNGSGKTTTIRMMCGLLTPDAGEGRVLGHDILTEGRAIKREVGYMTQRFSFYEDLTIEENLAFVAGLYALRPARRHVADTLAGLGLTSRRHQLAGALSG